MLGLLAHPYVTGPVAAAAIYLAETSGDSTRANVALVLGVIAALGTLYGIFDRERSHREGARPKRRHK